MFGTNYNKIDPINEIVHRYRKYKVLHIHSRRRLVDIFCISNSSYFEACIKIENDPIHMSNMVVSAAPKVILKNRDSGRQMVGYCIEEEDNGRFLKIITEGGKEIKINRPQYNGDTGEWDVSIGCNDDLDGNTYQVIEYHPIRIKLYNNGLFQILFYHIKLNIQSNKIVIN